MTRSEPTALWADCWYPWLHNGWIVKAVEDRIAADTTPNPQEGP